MTATPCRGRGVYTLQGKEPTQPSKRTYLLAFEQLGDAVRFAALLRASKAEPVRPHSGRAPHLRLEAPSRLRTAPSLGSWQSA